jgi:hypothetical protein
VRLLDEPPPTNRSQVKQMKASTKTKAAGKLREVEAALEAAVGEAARNRDLQAGRKGQKKLRRRISRS